MTPSIDPSGARRQLLLLAALFVLPMLVAYARHYSGWRPEAGDPPGERGPPALRGAGKPIRFSELRGKWTLVTFSLAECLKPCERNLTKMRQVIAAQGKEANRLQSVLVVTDGKALDWLRYAIQDFPGVRAVVGPPEAADALPRQSVAP